MTNRQLAISCALMLGTFLIISKVDIGGNISIQILNIDKFPRQIDHYAAAKDIIMQDSVITELNTDAFVYREYAAGENRTFTLYVGYYGTRKGGRTGHNPYGCYPGGGWSILEEAKVSLPVAIKGQTKDVTLNSLLVQKGSHRQLVYFWYQSSGDAILSTGIGMNIHRFTNRLLHHRNDGAFVRVSTSLDSDRSATEAQAKDFVRRIIPTLERYWPIEIEQT